MTREEYNNLTDEQRYSYILELEEEKKVSEKALEKVLESLKKNTTEDRCVLLDTKYDFNGLMLRAGNIVRAETTQVGTTIVTTIENGEEQRYTVKNSPLVITDQIERNWN